MPARPVPRRQTLVALLATCLLSASCGASPDAPGKEPGTGTGPARSAPSSQEGGGSTAAPPGGGPVVVVVSVDGLASRAVPAAGSGRVDEGGFTRLAREGASTLQARTVVEKTVTLPNHTSMLTGRRVLGPRGTGVVVNSDPGGTLADLTGAYVPGVFDAAHDAGLRTGFYAQKTKLDLLVRSWDARHGAPDTTGADDGRDKLDRVVVSTSTDVVTDALVDGLRSGTRLAFLHLAGPDVAGHRHGWMSAPYLAAVDDADAEVAALLRVVATDPDLRARTTVVVTADHGGRGRDHSRTSDPADYTVPFFVWGRGVTAGDLYDLDPDRSDPGSRQPSYDGPQPVRNVDAANLALRLLDLPLLPSYTGDPLPPLRTAR